MADPTAGMSPKTELVPKVEDGEGAVDVSATLPPAREAMERKPATRESSTTRDLLKAVGLAIIVGLIAIATNTSLREHTNAYVQLSLRYLQWLLPIAAVLLASLVEFGESAESRPRHLTILSRLSIVLFVVAAVIATRPDLPSLNEIKSVIGFQKTYGTAPAIPDTFEVAKARDLLLSGHSVQFRLPMTSGSRLLAAKTILDHELARATATSAYLSEVHALRSMTLSELRDTSGALAAAKTAVAFNANDSLALAIECRSYRRLGDLPAAMQACEAATKADPNSSLAWGEKGATTLASAAPSGPLDRRLYEKAASELEISLRGNEANAAGWNNLAIAYRKLGQPRKAIEAADHALRLSPRFEDALLNKATAYKDLKDLPSAIATYNKLLDLNRSDAEAWNNLGDAYDVNHNFDEALRCFRVAVTLKPDYETAWFNIGHVLNEKGQYADAIDALGKAASLDPRDADALTETAASMLFLGRNDEALQYAKRALALAPDDPQAQKIKSLAEQGVQVRAATH